jgi:hypothetical protein
MLLPLFQRNFLPPSSLKMEAAGYSEMHTMISTAMRTSDLIETAGCFFALLN